MKEFTENMVNIKKKPLLDFKKNIQKNIPRYSDKNNRPPPPAFPL